MARSAQDLDRIFSPLQIGSITTNIEPLNVASTVEWALELISDEPDADVVPVEENGAVLGVVPRSVLEELAKSVWSRFWQKNLDAYLIPAKDVVDATAHISRLIEVSAKKYRMDETVWYIVQYRRSYLGVVSLRHMMEYMSSMHSDDMLRAGEIQGYLLKQSYVRDKRFNAVFFNTMAHEIGGDFYRVYQATPDIYLVGCFDVAGKNISSAMTTMALGACFSSFELFKFSARPDRITRRISDLIRSVNPPGIFVTAVLFYIDFNSKHIRVHNCGFSPVYTFVKLENKITYKVTNPNLPPLGVLEDLDFSDNLIIPISKNLRLCAYSDGLPDMADIYGERCGDEKTAKLIKDLHRLSQPEIQPLMKKEISRWTGAASLADDITMVDIRFN